MSRIRVKVEKIRDKYYYATEEDVLRCPKCKRDYIKKKKCLHCSTITKPVETKPYTKERTGIITEDLKKYSCDCIFSSWFKFGKHWKENHPKSNCKHLKWSLKKIENEKL